MIAEDSDREDSDREDSDREDSDLTHIVSSVPWILAWNVEIINVFVCFWSQNTTPY